MISLAKLVKPGFMAREKCSREIPIIKNLKTTTENERELFRVTPPPPLPAPVYDHEEYLCKRTTKKERGKRKKETNKQKTWRKSR